MDASEVSGTLRPTLFSLSARSQDGTHRTGGLTTGGAAPRRQVNEPEGEESSRLSPLPEQVLRTRRPSIASSQAFI